MVYRNTSSRIVIGIIHVIIAFICSLIIIANSDIDTLQYDLDGQRYKPHFPLIEIGRIMNEIEAGNISVTPTKRKWIEAAYRMQSYGWAPFIIIWFLSYAD